MLSGAELGKLAEKMCAATDSKKVDALMKKLIEGFYGRHLLPEELQSPPISPQEQEEWIAKIKNGEAEELSATAPHGRAT